MNSMKLICSFIDYSQHNFIKMYGRKTPTTSYTRSTASIHSTGRYRNLLYMFYNWTLKFKRSICQYLFCRSLSNLHSQKSSRSMKSVKIPWYQKPILHNNKYINVQRGAMLAAIFSLVSAAIICDILHLPAHYGDDHLNFITVFGHFYDCYGCLWPLLFVYGFAGLHSLWLLLHFLWIRLCWKPPRYLVGDIKTQNNTIIMQKKISLYYSSKYSGNVRSILIPCWTCGLCNIDYVSCGVTKGIYFKLSALLIYTTLQKITFF